MLFNEVLEANADCKEIMIERCVFLKRKKNGGVGGNGPKGKVRKQQARLTRKWDGKRVDCPSIGEFMSHRF